MFKKKFLCLLSLILAFSCFCGCSDVPTEETVIQGGGKYTVTEGESMGTSTATKSEFDNLFKDLTSIPVSFTYNDVHYNGFGGFKFVKETVKEEDDKLSRVIELKHPDNVLYVTLETAFYNDYDAYEWTVYFENKSTSKNSSVLTDLLATDMTVDGANPVLKGNVGDYGGYYAPFSYDLSKTTASFTADTGRSAEQYMPFFNLETDEGGYMIAVGWSGTWSAKFEKVGSQTRISTTGTVGLKTYLKPGEKVRTPLMAFVRYYERNEDTATNKWRKWMINCNLPYEDSSTKTIIQPASIVGFVSDTEYGWYRGGSGDENSNTWRATYEALRSHNLKFDYHWFDAGWYTSPTGGTLEGNNWYPTGTWTVDKVKWPTGTLAEYNTTVKKDLATKGTVMWFETERYHGGLSDVQNLYGANPDWYYPESNQNYLLWLGNSDAVNWAFNKITTAMTEAGADIYREDHNFSPSSAFLAGDVLQGENRNGITENLHFQGKYALWERIIDWQEKTGRPSFIEMQSSGGNRQDLALFRYSVSFFRSDSDITLNPVAAVSKVNALNKWVPYGGVIFGQLSAHSDTNLRNKYQWRSTYSSTLCVSLQYQNLTQETWDLITWGMEEFDKYKTYTYYDFYELTPWKSLYDESQWVSRMYFDEETDKGVLETFNFKYTGTTEKVIQLKGVNPDHYYVLTDPDNANGSAKVKGSELIAGYKITLANESSSLIWIDPVKA